METGYFFELINAVPRYYHIDNSEAEISDLKDDKELAGIRERLVPESDRMYSDLFKCDDETIIEAVEGATESLFYAYEECMETVGLLVPQFKPEGGFICQDKERRHKIDLMLHLSDLFRDAVKLVALRVAQPLKASVTDYKWQRWEIGFFERFEIYDKRLNRPEFNNVIQRIYLTGRFNEKVSTEQTTNSNEVSPLEKLLSKLNEEATPFADVKDVHRTSSTKDPEQPKEKSDKNAFKDCIIAADKGQALAKLKELIGDRTGKNAVIVIRAAKEAGMLSRKPPFKTFVSEFGGIVSRSGYDAYQNPNTTKYASITIQDLQPFIDEFKRP